jgi:hypothetical protein
MQGDSQVQGKNITGELQIQIYAVAGQKENHQTGQQTPPAGKIQGDLLALSEVQVDGGSEKDRAQGNKNNVSMEVMVISDYKRTAMLMSPRKI